MNPLNLTRYYEVTGLRKGSPWDHPGSRSILGAIVRPRRDVGPSMVHKGQYHGEFRIVRQAASGRELYDVTIYIAGVNLRPLTIKEQEKVDGTRHDAA